MSLEVEMRIFSAFCLVVLLWPPVQAAVGDNSVGMNIHIGRDTFIDACDDLGVGWVRMDGNWFVMEPSQDNYNWAWMDEFVDRANAKGLKVFITLGYTPDWVPSHGEAGDGSTGDNCPDDETHWVDFVEDAVTHYRAMGVTHYGMWNEPNLDGFFDGTVEEYVDIIMVPGAAAVRRVCADCKVLGPELANVGDCDVYMENIFNRAPASTFDIITHHSYNGFTETGWNIWDGDGFINVLDDQRIPGFTRKDIRQILDAAGWTGEVWMTETGLRATPIGDSGEENRQATYYIRVLEEQLKRAWYTNTFFYEIHDCGPDQPQCTIDGYGIMRAFQGELGQREFPRDFTLKPAFHALKQFIIDHPEIVGTQPAPQCGDGQDNDNDDLTDLEDPGCTDAFDDDESDDPPKETLDAYRSSGIVIDGQLDDIGPDGWVLLAEESWNGTEQLQNPGDLSVRSAVRWDNNGLYFAFDVTDDIHQNDRTPDLLWASDSVQVALDTACNGGIGYDDTDDHEINFALANGQTTTFRFHCPPGATDDYSAAVVRDGSHTIYEIHIPPSALPGVNLAVNQRICYSFLVNEDDGSGRIGWIELTPGIGSEKAPAYFVEFIILNETSEPGQDGGDQDAGVDAGTDAGGGDDAGQPADEGTDAGGGDDAGQVTDEDQDAAPDGMGPLDGAGTDGGGRTDWYSPGTDDSCSCGASSGSGLVMLFFLPFLLLLRRRLPALILLLAVLAAGCGLDVVEIDVKEEVTVGGTSMVFPEMANFGGTLEKSLSDKDVDPGDVDSMKLLSCSIRMIGQGGLTNDLAFLEKLDFYVSANGMPQTLMASQPSFPDGIREADLTVTEDLELKPYLKAGDMKVSPDAPFVYLPPDLVSMEIVFHIRVDVNVI
jgi:hypothetical protein